MKIVLLLTGELGVNILSFLSERREEIDGAYFTHEGKKIYVTINLEAESL